MERREASKYSQLPNFAHDQGWPLAVVKGGALGGQVWGLDRTHEGKMRVVEPDQQAAARKERTTQVQKQRTGPGVASEAQQMVADDPRPAYCRHLNKTELHCYHTRFDSYSGTTVGISPSTFF